MKKRLILISVFTVAWTVWMHFNGTLVEPIDTFVSGWF